MVFAIGLILMVTGAVVVILTDSGTCVVCARVHERYMWWGGLLFTVGMIIAAIAFLVFRKPMKVEVAVEKEEQVKQSSSLNIRTSKRFFNIHFQRTSKTRPSCAHAS